MAMHTLKTWPSYFRAVVSKKKTFEVRTHDRDFAVGDTLVLLEYEPDSQSYGQNCRVQVTYLMTGVQFGIEKGTCVMGIKFTAMNMD